MIQVRIYLDKSSKLFKDLNKKKLLERGGKCLFVQMKHKPNVGELIYLDSCSVGKHEDELINFFNNRRSRVIIRVDDLMIKTFNLKSESFTCIAIKCHEENNINWDI
jgi:hypothetical protein